MDVNAGGGAVSGVGGGAVSGVTSAAGGGSGGEGGGAGGLTSRDGKSRTTILSMAALKVGQNSRCLGWVRNEVMPSLSSNVIEKTCVKPCVSMSWPSTSCPLSKPSSNVYASSIQTKLLMNNILFCFLEDFSMLTVYL